MVDVEVMPEIIDTNEIEIRPEDLKVDTYRSSGAGGQHVNKTKGTQDVIIANTRHHSSIRQTIHRQPLWHNCGDMSDEECNIRRHERNLYRDQQVAKLAVYETKASHLRTRKGWFTQRKQHIYEPIIKRKRLSR